MTAGLVTVVIPTRNRRALVEEAIASVMAQDYPAWELIVVDDASEDETPAYLETLADPRVRTIRLARHGERSAARNRGLAEARGEFVMFLDDDDLLRPGALSALAPALLADPVAVAAVGARYRFTAKRGVRIPHPASPMKLEIADELLCGWGSVSGQNLYRTQVVRAVEGFDPVLSLCEDRDLWLKLATRGPILTRPEIVVDFRVHEGQASRAGVEAHRHAVYSRHIALLPPERRARARRIQRSGEDRWSSIVLRQQGRRGAAFLAAVRSILRHPGVLRSPLLGPLTQEIFWNSLPPRLVRALSKARKRLTGRR